jgi:phosphate transport system permease protein
MALTTVRSSSEAAVEATVAAALSGRRADVRGRAFELGLLASLLVCLIVLGVLIAQVLADGLPVYTDRGWEFLDGGLSRRPAEAGISQGLIGSFWIALAVAAITFPMGVGAAVYLEEYAPRNRITSFIELNIRNLAGVPSVVYGLLGLAIFVEAMGGFSGAGGVARRTLAAAAITLAALALPIIIITAGEAIRAVPQSLREGAYGAGATRWEVIRTVVLPYAAPGMFTGALLSISRAVGEAAPLIVVGAVTGFSSQGVGLNPANIFNPSALGERFTAMPAVITSWAKQPEDEVNRVNTAAAIIGLLVFVILINAIAIVLRNRFEKKRSL